jgi:hypothetical protein
MPKALRRRALKLAQPDRKEEDVFPAFYRLNTAATLRRHFDSARFEHFVYAWDAEPSYFLGSLLVFRFFLALHAVSPAALKTMLYIFLHKKT